MGALKYVSGNTYDGFPTTIGNLKMESQNLIYAILTKSYKSGLVVIDSLQNEYNFFSSLPVLHSKCITLLCHFIDWMNVPVPDSVLPWWMYNQMKSRSFLFNLFLR